MHNQLILINHSTTVSGLQCLISHCSSFESQWLFIQSSVSLVEFDGWLVGKEVSKIGILIMD